MKDHKKQNFPFFSPAPHSSGKVLLSNITSKQSSGLKNRYLEPIKTEKAVMLIHHLKSYDSSEAEVVRNI